MRDNDPHLQDRLNQVVEKITSADFLAGEGLGNEVGFWIFDYPAEYELQVREYLSFLEGVLERQHSDVCFRHIHLLRVLRDYLHKRGILEKAIAIQADKGDRALLNALRGPLHMDRFAPFFIREELSADPDIVLVSGVGSVWPLIRAHSLLNALHSRLGHKPLVLFYPGRFDGQSLTLFNRIKSDHYYRAFALVP
ncbi:DUF1788 domain-containing protein [Thioalkalivibrio sp. ALE11]|uniref:DUF1788 domain-containing protein n=1 Tax=Thioalkalivibrio sp. ALE11 TaxID=1265494 RepID=UPI00056F2D60|nr:DUF1788 domain-containing protein [Thioalkalivibrio sp. ALE11]